MMRIRIRIITDEDPDPACHFIADMDPTFHLMRARILASN